MSMTGSGMRGRWLILAVVFALWSGPVAVAPVSAQGDPVPSPEPTAVPEPTPIPASEIPARAGEVKRVLRDLEAELETRAELTDIAESLPGLVEDITAQEAEARPHLDADGPPSTLRDFEAEFGRLVRKSSEWLEKIGERAVALEDRQTDLGKRRDLWELTLRSAGESELPQALVRQVREILAEIDSARGALRDRRSETLTLQAEVAEQHTRASVIGDEIRREIESRTRSLVRIDSEPLWRAFGKTEEEEDLGEQVIGTIRKNVQAARTYVGEERGPLVLSLFVYLCVLAAVIRLGRVAELWVRTDGSLTMIRDLLQRPVAASLMLTIPLLENVTIPEAPDTVQNLLGMVLLLALLRLLPIAAHAEMRAAANLLVSLVVLYLVVDLIPNTYLLDRLGKLALAALGAATGVLMIRVSRTIDAEERTRWHRVAVGFAALAVALFTVSAVGNIIGAVAFASLLAVATLKAAYDAIVLWVALTVLFGAVTLALRTTTARRLHVIRDHGQRIRDGLVRVFGAVAALSWFAYALDGFDLLDGFFEGLRKVIDLELGIGGFSLSVSSVVIFIVVGVLSYKLSQLVRFFLDEDVLPRLDLPRGAPVAISKLSTYLVLTLGFLIAVSAAGVDFGKLAFLVGALGVGIGFGLQNVVNNFVSGLILLFERPVKVGDKIEIGALSGEVRDIGIRASVVRTYQGADVVVPNANLISDNLVNWTLTDRRRRMDIPVGVAYGSSVELVIGLVLEVAAGHEGVLEDPAPEVLFTAFGSSSLDLELRAWTTGNFVKVASELRASIYDALSAAGVEIPFPQRDIHLRSTDAAGVGDLAAAKIPVPEE